MHRDAIIRHNTRLLRSTGATIVRPATKIVGGIDTGAPCVQFGVAAKLSPGDIPQGAVIPPAIGGVVTDVVETSRPRALAAPTDRVRPVVGGMSGMVFRAGYAGTIGAVVRDATTSRLVGLTCNHIAGLQYNPAYDVPAWGLENVSGQPVIQPSALDGGTIEGDTVGEVVRAVTLNLGTSAPVNACDAAVFSMDDINSAWFAVNNVHAGPFPFAQVGEYARGDSVCKSGRTTGMTAGTITTLYASAAVDYGDDTALFTDQMIIEGPGISDSGDSGSVVLAIIDGVLSIIGLLFAGYTSAGQDYALVTHIGTVAAALDIEAWDGSVVLLRNPEPYATVNGVGFTRSGDVTAPATHTEDV